MENLELNKQEKKELEKRGFFVKKNYTIKSYINQLIVLPIYISWASISILVLFCIIYPITLNIFSETNTNFAAYLTIILLTLTLAYPIGIYLKAYISAGVTFFMLKHKIEYGLFGYIGEKGLKNSNLLIVENYLLKITAFIKKSSSGGVFDSLESRFFVYIFIPFIVLIFIPASLFGGGTNTVIYFLRDLLLLYLMGFILFILGMNFIRIGFQHFVPIYNFGNIGEKIQKLTPKIEEKSKQIQSEFKSDMNFSVLSNGFDSLSSTFSSIVTLVIKLEKVEARANKGNLFDSEKYINSLRSDIVTPLTSLKVFLEKQKMELIKSQYELSRIRVGGNESIGNVELQSKRSDSLIIEVTENIEKLDMMIGKMGV